MTQGIRTIIYPVEDLTRAKALLTALLGAEPSMDSPYYVQFDAAGQSIGLDPRGHGKGMTGPTPFWHVDDVRARVDALVAAGAQIREPIGDVGGGKLVATLADPDGNPIGLIQET